MSPSCCPSWLDFVIGSSSTTPAATTVTTPSPTLTANVPHPSIYMPGFPRAVFFDGFESFAVPSPNLPLTRVSTPHAFVRIFISLSFSLIQYSSNNSCFSISLDTGMMSFDTFWMATNNSCGRELLSFMRW